MWIDIQAARDIVKVYLVTVGWSITAEPKLGTDKRLSSLCKSCHY